MSGDQHTIRANPLQDDESDFRREPKPEFIRLPKDRAYRRKLDMYADQGIMVTMEAEDLQGESRVVVEGLLSEAECENLIDLATVSFDFFSLDIGDTRLLVHFTSHRELFSSYRPSLFE